MKICEFEGCNNPVFSGGYCSWHQWKRTDKKKSYINYKSKKRKDEEDPEYKCVCDELDREAKEDGAFACFFTNKLIARRASHHHLRGRGKYLLDKRFIVLAIEVYHQLYHSLSVKELEKTGWYNIFLENLKDKPECEDLYELELEKKNK